VSWRRAIPWLVLFALLGAAGGGGCEAAREEDQGRDGRGPALRPNARLDAVVTRVVDGDTVRVRLDGRSETVRYIGVDTPESVNPRTPVECFGKAASDLNRRLMARERVRLRLDAEPRDRYGRLLAYVFRRRDGLFVNDALVRRGFATILTIPPNVAEAARLRGAQREAREARRGLWAACPVTRPG
jgi:micrococcal nuclease